MYIYEIRLKSDHSKNIIGQTTRRPEIRWAEHRSAARCGKDGCPHLHNALRKYGEDAFEFVILNDTAKNQDELNCLEILYKNIRGDHYGISIGGAHGAHTEEIKQKMRQSAKGRKMPPRTAQHLKNISDSLRGRPLSSEHKKKLSNALKGRKFTAKHKKNLSIAARRRCLNQ